MKKSKFTEEQILFALKQGTLVSRSRTCAGRWGSARRRTTTGRSATATSGCSRCASCGNFGTERSAEAPGG